MEKVSHLFFIILRIEMEMKKKINTLLQVAMSLLLGGAILYWMYRGFNIRSIEGVMLHQMDWTWMILSFPFGIFAQVFRGWRWRQTLEPLGEKPRQSVAVNSIRLLCLKSAHSPYRRICSLWRTAALGRCVVPEIARYRGYGARYRHRAHPCPHALHLPVAVTRLPSLFLAHRHAY